MATQIDQIANLKKALEKKYADSAELFPPLNYVRKIPVIPSRSAIINAVTGVGGFPKGRMVEVFGPESTGKGLPLDEPILASKKRFPQSGFKFYENRELEVGDIVKCPDGSNSSITGVFKHRRPVFKITFKDGSSSRCDDQHLWPIVVDGDYSCEDRNWPYRVIPMAKLLEMYEKGRFLQVPLLTSPPEMGRSLTTDALDPYMVGLVLGDGLVDTAAAFWTTDDQLGSYVETQGFKEVTYQSAYERAVATGNLLLRQWKLQKKDDESQWNKWRLSGLRGKTAEDKSVPPRFLNGPVEVRLSLLQGLMDTDGSVDSTGVNHEFSSKSKQLAEDVQFLVRSLGGQARIGPEKIVDDEVYYRVGIRISHCHLFRLDRKRDRERVENTRAREAKTIEAIEPLGEMDTQCISIDHPAGLFITRDFTVTHNTTFAIDACASLQQANKDAVALFVDYEQAFDARYAHALGLNLDPSKFIFAQPDYFEQGAVIIENYVEEGLVDLIVIDSAAAMTPRAQLEGASDGTFSIGLQSRLMSEFLSKITKKINKGRKVALILINQTRTKIDVNNPRNNGEDAAGGKAIKFYSSIRLALEIVKKEGEENRGQKGTDQVYTQNRVRITAVKNKVAPPFIRGTLVLEYGKGINNLVSVAELAEARLGIMSGAGFFKYKGASEKTSFALRGREAFIKLLEEREDIRKEIETKVLQAISLEHAAALGVSVLSVGESAKEIEEPEDEVIMEDQTEVKFADNSSAASDSSSRIRITKAPPGGMPIEDDEDGKRDI